MIQLSLEALRLTIKGRKHVYLEQDRDPSGVFGCVTPLEFSGLNDNPNGFLISVRYWNFEQEKPSSLRDFVVDKKTTVAQLKRLVSPYVGWKASGKRMGFCHLFQR